jgi:hypothetical protein
MLPLSGGCSLIVPTAAHQPVIRNPFPQLSRVAVAPFFNQSDEPTLDGRQVALAYFAELQSTPGFEVVPLGVVEEAIISHRVDLHGPGEARRLAGILGVDAVVVGSITDFSEYYPPRMGLRIEWYTANPGFHEIPAGYGLPWGTPEEEFIPDSLVYESQMALAKAQLAAKTPDCEQACQSLPAPAASATPDSAAAAPVKPSDAAPPAEHDAAPTTLKLIDADSQLQRVALEEPLPPGGATDATPAVDAEGASVAQPSDPNCLAGAAAGAGRPPCVPYYGPVLSHTRIYRGNDADVTEALEGYVYFRDDLRFGGWKSYLARSDDFIRFCCHMHICEMLSARGGSRKTDVVYRWPERR